MTHKERKAFLHESGQFICHVYAKIDTEYCQVLEDMTTIIQRQQSQDKLDLVRYWDPITTSENEDFHITLVRGHRAIYYHQIKFLLEAIQRNCHIEKPITVCLDDLRVFNNFENTKQFLCLASSNDTNICNLKQNLRNTIDKFAITLTNEDETEDTTTHCSFMFRDNLDNNKQDQVSTVSDLNSLFESQLGELPICQVRLNSIQVKIGNHVYNLNLNG